MLFDYDDAPDLDELLQDVAEEAQNEFIADPAKAIALLAGLIRNESSEDNYKIREIRLEIDRLFDALNEDSLPHELQCQRRLNDLCDYLSQVKKIRKIQDKTVISLGGQFSAGKSKFINAISGIGQTLPEAQSPTTSIPTYIIHSDQSKLTANSVFGYTYELTPTALQALTHAFYDAYHIGFSAYIDSIIAQSPEFSLDKSIALLDTPGYNKYDEKANTRLSLSDRQKAFEQLKITDYLIWLVDIDNGVLQEEDKRFIESLHIDTPILIVFTKADKKTEEDIQSILALAEETVKNAGFRCFGITAYSSTENREYGANLIASFFEHVAQSGMRCNDVMQEVLKSEQLLKDEIETAVNEADKRSKQLYRYLIQATDLLSIRSLASIWGEESQRLYHYYNLQMRFETAASRLNKTLQSFLTEANANE